MSGVNFAHPISQDMFILHSSFLPDLIMKCPWLRDSEVLDANSESTVETTLELFCPFRVADPIVAEGCPFSRSPEGGGQCAHDRLPKIRRQVEASDGRSVDSHFDTSIHWETRSKEFVNGVRMPESILEGERTLPSEVVSDFSLRKKFLELSSNAFQSHFRSWSST